MGEFSQAACRVNRWQDCTAQQEEIDCENSDKRDCTWRPGVALSSQNKTKIGGACIPNNPPGLKFWSSDEARAICAQGNYQCVVTYEKGLIGGEKCVDGCECLKDDWAKQRAELCSSLGDCGPNVNWVNEKGFKSGYNVSIAKSKTENQAAA